MHEINIKNKLRPLVQLAPAAVVAAAILLTLPHTAPTLAQVPERLSAPVQPAAEAPEEPAEEPEALPTLPYEDGVYTGASRGYGGRVKVQVTMQDGYITDLQILSASRETASFLKRARRLLSTVLEQQTWEVDAVSEATYTSRGILGAIQNALTGEEVINPLPPQPKAPEPLVVEEFTAPSAYRDGVYTASAEGYGGPITVQVTVSGDAIADISIVDASGETRSYFTRARRVVSAILESGSPEVDAVAGATYSSTGILNAVKLALAKAANDAAAPQPEPEPQPEAQYADGVYTSTVEQADGTATVSVTVTDGRIASVEVQRQPEEFSDFFAWAESALTSLFTGQFEQAAASGEVYTEETLPEQLRDAVQAALSQPEPEQPQDAEPEAPSAPTEEPPADAAPESTPEPDTTREEEVE